MAKKTLGDLSERLGELGDHGIMDAIERIALIYGIEGERKAKKMSRLKLTPRTGRLWSSIKATVEKKENTVTLTLRAGNKKNVPYARIHEVGGVITPKKGKFLRIPLPNALTSKGVDRFQGPLKALAKDKFYVAKSKKGSLLLFDSETNKPWYLLVKRVKIPPRPTLGPVHKWVNKNMIPELDEILQAEMKLD